MAWNFRDFAGAQKTMLSETDGSGYHANRIVLAKTDASKTAYQAVDELTFIDRIGEKQDTPSAFTLLRRLKDLLSLIVLAAGENFVGKTAPPRTVIDQTPTIDTAIYASGDALGGKLTFASAVRASGGNAVVKAVTITDLDKENALIDLILFDSDPTGTTITNNVALDIADADLPKIIAVVKVATAAGDYADFVDNSVVQKHSLDIPVKAVGSTSLYGVLVVRGTPTYTAATDITVRLQLEQG